MKKIFKVCLFCILISSFVIVGGCGTKDNGSDSILQSTVHDTDKSKLLSDFKNILKKNPEVKEMFKEAIEKGKEINPDIETNPVRSLEDYYSFIAWGEIAMPWNIEYNISNNSLFNQIDQSLDYFYFLLDIPLEQLEGKGLYYNSLEFYEPIKSWCDEYAKQWGRYLSTTESWNNQYYQHAYSDKSFGLQNNWYENKKNWHTFNQFFARKLSSSDARPISNPTDDSVLTAPADSKPQGVWNIDDDSKIKNDDQTVNSDTGGTVQIKSMGFNSVQQLLHGSKYANSFAGGTLTHTFLNVNDYHRYHFPMSGKVLETGIIPSNDSAGGLVVWDEKLKKYVLNSTDPNWESVETRAYVILDTKKFGKVALLPVGMSQVSSVNINKNIKPGVSVKKGDELGYFLFGGSDFVIVLQKGIDIKMSKDIDLGNGEYSHLLMGEKYATLSLSDK